MPKPPAAFSPLTMTRSTAQSRIMPGKCSEMAVRPALPTTSPTKRMRKLQTPEIEQLRFRYQIIQRHVVWQRRNSLDFLHREGEADGDDFLRITQARERAVIMSGAITDPVTRSVERGQRNQYDVGNNFGSIGRRLG